VIGKPRPPPPPVTMATLPPSAAHWSSTICSCLSPAATALGPSTIPGYSVGDIVVSNALGRARPLRSHRCRQGRTERSRRRSPSTAINASRSTGQRLDACERRSMPNRAAEPTHWHNQARRRSASGRPVQLHGPSDSGNSFDHESERRGWRSASAPDTAEAMARAVVMGLSASAS